MVSFKCKLSGCVYKYDLEHDIAEMRKHDGYEEVKVEAQSKVEQPPTETIRRGRPPKQTQ